MPEQLPHPEQNQAQNDADPLISGRLHFTKRSLKLQLVGGLRGKFRLARQACLARYSFRCLQIAQVTAQ